MRTYDCVIPVHNEEKDLEANILTLHGFLTEHLSSHDWCIVIADNASIDSTGDIAARLAATLPRVAYHRLDLRGRGRALKTTWMQSNADFVSYMDVDLSTNLAAVPEMMELFEKASDVVLGSRLIAGANITRCWYREILSRGWNFLVGAVFNTRFSDAQCGFKGMRREAKEILVPQVEDTNWFFDTEFLVLAEKQGFKMNEIAVEWIEDLGSTVQIPRTVLEDLTAMARLKWRLSHGRNLARTPCVPSGAGYPRRSPGGAP
jgi:glycosyltransferase involved in cell wall biosynthesis